MTTALSTRFELSKVTSLRSRRAARARLHRIRVTPAAPSPGNKDLLDDISRGAYDFLASYIDFHVYSTVILSTTKREELNQIPSTSTTAVVNLARVNDMRYINKFFIGVNAQIADNGIFAGCVETIEDRTKRKQSLNIPVLKQLRKAIDFTFLRVFPKVWGLKKIYFFFTKGKRRLLSKAETLGRLVCCGFEIVDCQQHNNLHYFVAKRVKSPTLDKKPSYGPLYRMNRISKNGKIIGVYKFRTMHPYSEYLQDYVLRLNGYADSGKPQNDFRLTFWGKMIRRYWIDEIPQLINVLRGEMKLVGVRPVSPRYFQDIPEHIQRMRLTQKPGCIPPYVALNRKSTVKSVLGAEELYLRMKLKKPLTTDTRLFFTALYNIIIKSKRSA